MSTLKDRLLTNWHLMRIMRLGIGIMILVMGIQSHDWAFGLFSIFFIYQAVTDTGCCGAQGCNTPRTRKTHAPVRQVDDSAIEYEEVK